MRSYVCVVWYISLLYHEFRTVVDSLFTIVIWLFGVCLIALIIVLWF